MPRSARATVCHLVFALLNLSSAAAAAPNIWAVDILEGPAPPPEEGPPLSAHAQRDPVYLPYQLVAVFGSYLVSLLVVGIAIVIIGRRRRSIQTSPNSLGMEMKTGLTGDGRRNKLVGGTPQLGKLFGASPVSPNKYWQSPNMGLRHGWDTLAGKSSKKTSVAGVSVSTIDESVIEDDRLRNELELDRLYAAVAEHEAMKDAGHGIAEISVAPVVVSQSPPELQHLRYGINQPDYDHGPAEMVEPYISRTSTTSPARHTNSISPPARSVSGGSARRARKTPPAALSLNPTANSSHTSLASARSRSLRHFPISPPMGSPGIATGYGDKYGDTEPLTPRAYAPGPPPIPPTPTSHFTTDRESDRHREVLASPQHPPSHVSPRATHFAPSIRSSRSSNANASVTSPGLPTSPRSFRAPPLSARSGAFPHTITERPSQESSMRSGHRRGKSSMSGMSYVSCESDIKPGFDFALEAHPVQESGRGSPTGSTATTGSNNTSATAGGKKSRRPAPPTLALHPVNPNSANGSSVSLTAPGSGPSSSLPLRNLRDMRSPTSRGPPSAIKATFLERPSKRGVGQGAGGGLLRAPGTAGLGPATPYSPYMPQTPMTPMTPSRLITREERKRREREEGRRVLTQADVVQEESEMWGDDI